MNKSFAYAASVSLTAYRLKGFQALLVLDPLPEIASKFGYARLDLSEQMEFHLFGSGKVAVYFKRPDVWAAFSVDRHKTDGEDVAFLKCVGAPAGLARYFQNELAGEVGLEVLQCTAA